MAIVAFVVFIKLPQRGPLDNADVNTRMSIHWPSLREDEITELPQWQEDLLADPGWNQPHK
jgi:hypothetical protein